MALTKITSKQVTYKKPDTSIVGLQDHLDGLVIGTTVQAYDADLTTWAGISPGTNVGAFLTAPTSANLAAAVTDETGSGDLVFATSPTLVTPALGTPSSLVGTNITGTAAGLTAGNVTTNANLTGHVTSIGNAAVLGSFTLAQLNTAVSDADVATLAGSEALTNKTLTNPSYSGATANGGTVTTIDINGGTIDGTAIGGAGAAEGHFTTLSTSGAVTAINHKISSNLGATYNYVAEEVFKLYAADTVTTADICNVTLGYPSGGSVMVEVVVTSQNSGTDRHPVSYRKVSVNFAGAAIAVSDLVTATNGSGNINFTYVSGSDTFKVHMTGLFSTGASNGICYVRAIGGQEGVNSSVTPLGVVLTAL